MWSVHASVSAHAGAILNLKAILKNTNESPSELAAIAHSAIRWDRAMTGKCPQKQEPVGTLGGVRVALVVPHGFKHLSVFSPKEVKSRTQKSVRPCLSQLSSQ